jgi:hypothetical protein
MKRKFSGGGQKILKIFKEASIETKTIDCNLDIMKILKMAELDEKLYKIGNSHFCCYKTEYQESNAVVIVFYMTSLSNLDNADLTMRTLDLLERLFMPVDVQYLREEDNNRTISLLKLICKLLTDEEEDDYDSATR